VRPPLRSRRLFRHVSPGAPDSHRCRCSEASAREDLA
jgi:hypothetical protein